MFSVIYSDKLIFNIILQLKLNNININLEINAVFNFLKIFCFYSIHYYRTSSINFVKSIIIFIKNLMNY